MSSSPDSALLLKKGQQQDGNASALLLGHLGAVASLALEDHEGWLTLRKTDQHGSYTGGSYVQAFCHRCSGDKQIDLHGSWQGMRHLLHETKNDT